MLPHAGNQGSGMRRLNRAARGGCNEVLTPRARRTPSKTSDDVPNNLRARSAHTFARVPHVVLPIAPRLRATRLALHTRSSNNLAKTQHDYARAGCGARDTLR